MLHALLLTQDDVEEKNGVLDNRSSVRDGDVDLREETTLKKRHVSIMMLAQRPGKATLSFSRAGEGLLRHTPSCVPWRPRDSS